MNEINHTYFYLHIDGSFHAEPDSAYKDDDFDESDFVKCWWKPTNGQEVMAMIFEAVKLGVSPQQATKLFQDIALFPLYNSGFIDGLEAFAHWQDGRQYVGTSGMLLEKVLMDLSQCATHGRSLFGDKDELKLSS